LQIKPFVAAPPDTSVRILTMTAVPTNMPPETKRLIGKVFSPSDSRSPLIHDALALKTKRPKMGPLLTSSDRVTGGSGQKIALFPEGCVRAQLTEVTVRYHTIAQGRRPLLIDNSGV